MGHHAYLDSNFFIRFVESEDDGLLFVFEQSAAGLLQLSTSELTLAEVLAGALRLEDEALAAKYEEFLTTDDELEVVPITRSVLRESARIRIQLGNKTPDAIHIATALQQSCDIFISSDRRLRLPDRLLRIGLDHVADADAWS